MSISVDSKRVSGIYQAIFQLSNHLFGSSSRIPVNKTSLTFLEAGGVYPFARNNSFCPIGNLPAIFPSTVILPRGHFYWFILGTVSPICKQVCQIVQGSCIYFSGKEVRYELYPREGTMDIAGLQEKLGSIPDHCQQLKKVGAFFTQRDFAPQNPQGKKPGYPLQSSGFCFAKSARISASIQAAWTSSNPVGIATSPLRAQGPGCRGSPASLLPPLISP
jgi:hypothetical protein